MDTKSLDTTLSSANLFLFLFKWWKLIVTLCVIAALGSTIASFLIEEKFKSTIVMFAAPQHSIGEQFYEEQKKQDLLAFGEKEDAERLLQILNSDKIQNRIIQTYNLWEHYEIEPNEPGANTLMAKEYKSNVSSKLTKFGSIQTDVFDKSDTLAALMANEIALLLDSVSNQLRNERAMEAFQYAQATLEQVLREIRTLEDSMSVIHALGIYDYSTQIETLNEQYGIAILNAQTERAQELKEEMDHISKYGNAYNKLDKLLESAYQREEVLKRRYDLMYLDATSKLPAKFVVDYAAVSDKKAYPVRWLIVAMSVAATFVLSIIGILALNNIQKLKNQDQL